MEEKIMKIKDSAKLMTFIEKNGNGTDIPIDFEPIDDDFSRFPPNFGIQQNLEEFQLFIDTCNDLNLRKSILEIGFGYFGSSHMVLRHNFEYVLSIDISIERMRNFYFNALDFFGKDFFDHNKSFFIQGDSSLPQTLIKTQECIKKLSLATGLDVLFIDGNHTYESVLMDFHLYEKFVKIDGLVAFHDFNNPMQNGGVPKFLLDLERGGFLNNRYTVLKKISVARNLGIYVLKKLN